MQKYAESRKIVQQLKQKTFFTLFLDFQNLQKKLITWIIEKKLFYVPKKTVSKKNGKCTSKRVKNGKDQEKAVEKRRSKF